MRWRRGCPRMPGRDMVRYRGRDKSGVRVSGANTLRSGPSVDSIVLWRPSLLLQELPGVVLTWDSPGQWTGRLSSGCWGTKAAGAQTALAAAQCPAGPHTCPPRLHEPGRVPEAGTSFSVIRSASCTCRGELWPQLSGKKRSYGDWCGAGGGRASRPRR